MAPLFEAYRRYLLDTAEPTGAVPRNELPPESDEEYYVDVPLSALLWEPWGSPTPEEYLPEAVDPASYEPRVMEDATDGQFEDPELKRVCEQYSDTAALVDRDEGESAVNGLLLDVAARLTERDWKGRLDVTADFVVLAYEYDPPAEQVAATLKHSLPPLRRSPRSRLDPIGRGELTIRPGPRRGPSEPNANMCSLKAKLYERAEARRLRAEGWRLRRIALALNVSLSSASTWTSGVEPRAEEPVRPAADPASQRVMECGKCHAKLPADEFAKSKRGAQAWCRTCYRAYFHARGELHLQQTKAARTRRRARARRFVRGILSISRCLDCGHDDALALEFDHVISKRANVFLLTAEGYSLRRILEEVSLCEVVCVNCHRRRTIARRGTGRLDRQILHAEPWPAKRRNLLRLCDELDGAACADCGSDDRDVLEFDHRGGKRDNVMTLACGEYSLEVLETEIAKCDVRCANCHRRRTRLAQGAVP